MLRENKPRRSGGRRRAQSDAAKPVRETDYVNLRHPFQPQAVFSDDEIANIHNTALRVIEELGIKVLLPEARDIFSAAGARVDDDTMMVHIGADLVNEALKAAPKSFRLKARSPLREQQFEDGAMLFGPGSGCPNVSDFERGRRIRLHTDTGFHRNGRIHLRSL